MAATTQLVPKASPQAKGGACEVSPAVKDWLRNVLVPALVREYTAARREKILATPQADVRELRPRPETSGSVQ